MSSAFAGGPVAGVAAQDGGHACGRPVVEILEVGAEHGVDLAGDVALEAAHDLSLGLAFACASLDVVAGALAVAQTHHCDEVKRSVRLPVATGVETMAVGLSR